MNDNRSTWYGQRQNMAQRDGEAWRPPLIAARGGLSRKLLARLRRWLDLQAGSIWDDLAPELARAAGTVADVGCGSQPYRPLLAPGCKYIGLDTADAKSHFGYSVPDTLECTETAWPLEDESVDVLLMTEVLEHVIDPTVALGEARRCLRGGGRLLLTVPLAARWHFIPYDYWRFTPSCLKRLLEAAGFEDIEVYARGNALTVACYKSMALILPLILAPQGGVVGKAFRRGLGLCLSPLLAILALVGNLSLRGPGGDDCLGYTLIARKAMLRHDGGTTVESSTP
jgi:SAM-dependent methyltransferase